jgi:hypothetical protein
MRGVGMPFRIILTAFLLVASLAALSSAPGFVTCAWSQGADPIAQGNDLYNQGKFKEAADLLKGAIDKGEVKPADLGAARELLARSMVKADRRGEARETFKAILRKDAAYRPDPNKVPPDEVAVFDEALRDFQAEQLEQGKRIPASIGGVFGYGMYKPKDINDAIKKFDEDFNLGAGDEIKGDVEFGGSVRFPLRPRLSLDLEIIRFHTTVSDAGPRTSTPDWKPSDFEVSALPVVANLYYNVWSKPHIRANVFGGLGPMLVSYLSVTLNVSLAPELPSFAKTGTKTGFYGHLGVEGEYLITPRLSLCGRVLGRMANAGKVISYDAKGATEGFVRFNDKSVSFSGFGFDVGLRAYIGY